MKRTGLKNFASSVRKIGRLNSKSMSQTSTSISSIYGCCIVLMNMRRLIFQVNLRMIMNTMRRSYILLALASLVFPFRRQSLFLSHWRLQNAAYADDEVYQFVSKYHSYILISSRDYRHHYLFHPKQYTTLLLRLKHTNKYLTLGSYIFHLTKYLIL